MGTCKLCCVYILSPYLAAVVIHLMNAQAQHSIIIVLIMKARQKKVTDLPQRSRLVA